MNVIKVSNFFLLRNNFNLLLTFDPTPETKFVLISRIKNMLLLWCCGCVLCCVVFVVLFVVCVCELSIARINRTVTRN